jgi:hypothetical protein
MTDPNTPPGWITPGATVAKLRGSTFVGWRTVNRLTDTQIVVTGTDDDYRFERYNRDTLYLVGEPYGPRLADPRSATVHDAYARWRLDVVTNELLRANRARRLDSEEAVHDHLANLTDLIEAARREISALSADVDTP